MFAPIFISLASLAAHAVAQETHTVTFINNCGKGTPMLIQGPNVLSTGQQFSNQGPLISAIVISNRLFVPAFSYLQTGHCGFNGESCTLVETTLRNPSSPGAGSSSDISLIPPHVFNVPAGFNYVGGCTTGENCTSPGCPGAFTNPTNGELVDCEANNVGLVIKFCD